MKRILVIFYSQSGEADRLAAIFESEMADFGHSVAMVRLRPLAEYPYPWGSIRRFFDVMPETQLGRPKAIRRPPIDSEAAWDLVVLVSPVWFLAPALPVQGFFRAPEAAVLRDRAVMTVTVSRAMWQQASETLKALLARAGARHVDNVVVTHRGSPVGTLVSTPRALISGKKAPLAGVFPEAGIGVEEHARVRRLARVAAARLGEGEAVSGSLLAGEPAVHVSRWLIVPEIAGWHAFHGWARAIRGLARFGRKVRAAAVWAFAVFLLVMIVIGLPLTLVATPFLHLLARPWLERRAARLAAPTGEMVRNPA